MGEKSMSEAAAMVSCPQNLMIRVGAVVHGVDSTSLGGPSLREAHVFIERKGISWCLRRLVRHIVLQFAEATSGHQMNKLNCMHFSH